jgi:hypothetical protein
LEWVIRHIDNGFAIELDHLDKNPAAFLEGSTDFVPAPGLDEPENLERSEGTPLAVFHSFSSERSRRNPSSVETLGA